MGVSLSELGENVGNVVSQGLSLCDADLVIGGTLRKIFKLPILVSHLQSFYLLFNNKKYLTLV
jgi:hypothetical protein